MLLISSQHPQPLAFASDMNSLLRPKMSTKMTMINGSGSSDMNGKSPSQIPFGSPGRSITPNSKYLRSIHPSRSRYSFYYPDQRKIRNSTEVLQNVHTDMTRDLLKHQEDTKKRCVQESQQCEGCFATVMEASHLNFVIPCIPMHLSSTRQPPTS